MMEVELKFNPYKKQGLCAPYKMYGGRDLVLDITWCKARPVVDARYYHSVNGNSFTCHLWILDSGGYRIGSGIAKGYGYDKKAAALMKAFACACVEVVPSDCTVEDIWRWFTCQYPERKFIYLPL